MSETAYTIGHEYSYDEALKSPPVTKTGRFVDKRVRYANGYATYPGGIVFRSVEEAEMEAGSYAEHHGEPFAVYELALESWDDVYEVRDDDRTIECLRVDRPIIQKVLPDPTTTEER